MKTVPDTMNTIEMYAFVISWNSASTGKLLKMHDSDLCYHQVKFSLLSTGHSLPPHACVGPCFYLHW